MIKKKQNNDPNTYQLMSLKEIFEGLPAPTKSKGKEKIKVSFGKLGRERADGLAYKDDREIVIDKRLKGVDLLETFVHEILHIQNPKWAEIKIIGHAKEIANLLWDQGFRKVDF